MAGFLQLSELLHLSLRFDADFFFLNSVCLVLVMMVVICLAAAVVGGI